jgi:hypothetical protein
MFCDVVLMMGPKLRWVWSADWGSPGWVTNTACRFCLQAEPAGLAALLETNRFRLFFEAVTLGGQLLDAIL